jgi:hypothetical protein
MFSRSTATSRADVPGRVLPMQRYFSIALLMLVLVALGGCAAATLKEIGATTSAKLATVQPGMSQSEVAAIMGSTTVEAKHGQMVRCPYRSDTTTTADGRTVEIFYYYTGGADLESESDHVIQYEELTPVVFENGAVIGGGWTYVQRNEAQLGIPIPESMKSKSP